MSFDTWIQQISADILSLLPDSFIQSSLVAKLVMTVLALGSIWSWVLIAEGLYSLSRLKRGAKRAAAGKEGRLMAPIFASGREAAQIAIAHEGAGEFRQRIVEAMNRRAQELFAEAERGLPNLAVIASVAPFIGLFGTVFGIMTSFAHIAEAKDTSLAVVAPGIAEALAATAWGLAAAIPASIAYNRLGASLGRTGQKFARLIDEHAVEIAARRKPTPLKEAA